MKSAMKSISRRVERLENMPRPTWDDAIMAAGEMGVYPVEFEALVRKASDEGVRKLSDDELERLYRIVEVATNRV
jgi:hypothetical protein